MHLGLALSRIAFKTTRGIGLRPWATPSCLFHYFLPLAFLIPPTGIHIIGWWFTAGTTPSPEAPLELFDCVLFVAVPGENFWPVIGRVQGCYAASKVWANMHHCLPRIPGAFPLRNTVFLELYPSFGVAKLALVFRQVIDSGFSQYASSKVSNWPMVSTTWLQSEQRGVFGKEKFGSLP